MDYEQSNVVQVFERNFAKYIGTKHAIACNSGTAALHIALLACGVKKGDEVITTPFTYTATSNAILYCNANPVYVDIYDDWRQPLIDLSKVEEKISRKTKVILPVNLFGKEFNQQDLIRFEANVYKKYMWKKTRKIYLINDASQCIKPRVNSFFDLTTFSFYKTKNFSGFEGGCVVTNDDELAKKCRLYVNQGESEKYNQVVLGYNYRMSDLTALMINHAITYHNIGGEAELGRWGIKDGHYPRVVYEQPYYKEIGLYKKWYGKCLIAEELARKVREGELK